MFSSFTPRKVLAFGGLACVPFIAGLALALTTGDDFGFAFCATGIVVFMALALFGVMVLGLRNSSRPAPIITPLLSSDATAFADASPITADEVAAAAALVRDDKAFMDDLTTHIVTFEDLRENGETA